MYHAPRSLSASASISSRQSPSGVISSGRRERTRT